MVLGQSIACSRTPPVLLHTTGQPTKELVCVTIATCTISRNGHSWCWINAFFAMVNIQVQNFESLALPNYELDLLRGLLSDPIPILKLSKWPLFLISNYQESRIDSVYQETISRHHRKFLSPCPNETLHWLKTVSKKHRSLWKILLIMGQCPFISTAEMLLRSESVSLQIRQVSIKVSSCNLYNTWKSKRNPGAIYPLWKKIKNKSDLLSVKNG